MNLTRVFQLSIYGGAAFAGMMLALAEGNSIPSGLVIVFAFIAWLLIENGWFKGLPGFASNFFGLVAFAAAAAEFFAFDPNNSAQQFIGDGASIEAKLLSGAHLLVYLQWIVLMQPKSRRQYWAISALALLQVAVGAVLTDEGWYGFLLVIFLLLQVWTLTVFSLLEARNRFERNQKKPDQPAPASASEKSRSLATAAQASALLSFKSPSTVRDHIQIDPGEPWINRRLVMTVLGTVALSLVVSSAVFAFTPRLWLSGNLSDGGSSGIKTETGISDEVRLGDMGQIAESDERVMNVELFNNDTNKSIDVEAFATKLGWDEPYFRGRTMATYSNGRWNSPRQMTRGNERMGEIVNRESVPGLVRHEIELQPTLSSNLFAMMPFYDVKMKAADGRQVKVAFSRRDMTLQRPRLKQKEVVRYQVFTPQSGKGPVFTIGDAFYAKEIARIFFTRVPKEGLERLKELAGRVSRNSSGETTTDQKLIASRLTSYLANGAFGYTLKASITNPEIDPIEDFLFNRKEGHCDYFASALTLMLRTQGIPARLVNGFKGGSRNTVTGVFEVQQRHAHAWVEAFYDGEWHLLDATPAAARTESVVQYDSQFKVINDVGTSLEDLWDRFVVDLSFEGQNRSIYQPLMEAFKKWMPGNEGAGWGTRALELLKNPDKWFSWQGGVVSFVLALILAGIYKLHPIRRLINMLKRMGKFTGKQDTKKIAVSFYERFHKLCLANQLSRTVGQTQQEFAGVVSGELKSHLEPAGLMQAPANITQFFYDVRFGNRDLSKEQLSSIDEQLTSLEQCLAIESNQSTSDIPALSQD